MKLYGNSLQIGTHIKVNIKCIQCIHMCKFINLYEIYIKGNVYFPATKNN